MHAYSNPRRTVYGASSKCVATSFLVLEILNRIYICILLLLLLNSRKKYFNCDQISTQYYPKSNENRIVEMCSLTVFVQWHWNQDARWPLITIFYKLLGDRLRGSRWRECERIAECAYIPPTCKYGIIGIYRQYTYLTVWLRWLRHWRAGFPQIARIAYTRIYYVNSIAARPTPQISPISHPRNAHK